jgi:hypothetical protein
MTFEETLKTLDAWVGQPVTLASWPIADPSRPWPHRPYHGTWERHREAEGTPDIAVYRVAGPTEDDLPNPTGTDIAIGRNTLGRVEWAPAAGGTVLRIMQGEVCMELILRVQIA